MACFSGCLVRCPVMASVTVRLYRYRDGIRSKDWARPVGFAPDTPGLTVYYGATGTPLRVAVTPIERCRHGSPLDEAEHRARQKQAKGYRDLGYYRLELGHRQGLTALTPAEMEALFGSTPVAPLQISREWPLPGDGSGWFY